MGKKAYINTSVVGGNFDDEFKFWTKLFFDSVYKGNFIVVISELLTEELRHAPKNARTFLDEIPSKHKIMYIELSEESDSLAKGYL